LILELIITILNLKVCFGIERIVKMRIEISYDDVFIDMIITLKIMILLSYIILIELILHEQLELKLIMEFECHEYEIMLKS